MVWFDLIWFDGLDVVFFIANGYVPEDREEIFEAKEKDGGLFEAREHAYQLIRGVSHKPSQNASQWELLVKLQIIIDQQNIVCARTPEIKQHSKQRSIQH